MSNDYELLEELPNGSVIPFYGDGPIGTFKLFLSAIRLWWSERHH